jgi:UPF0755 protein
MKLKKRLGLIAGGLALGLLALWLVPAQPAEGTVISVPLGAGLSHVAAELKKAHAIHSAIAFKLLARLTGRSGDIKAGDYQVDKGLNAFQTLDLLVDGKSMQHAFLIKEGASAAQVAAELQREGLGSAEKFLAVVRDPAQAKALGVPGSTLEGALFPDTYFLPKGMDEAAVAKVMVERFHQKVPDDLLAQGAAIKLTPLQVLTMASLIEKEAKLDSDRPMVSAVFRNRMRLKKRLESCASVRYALGKWTGPLYNKDLLAPSPYNTYQNFGLPPGPISNPGLKSIDAALHPAQTDALFFVVNGDGTHAFSKTYEQFLKDKAQYKRKLRQGVVEE